MTIIHYEHTQTASVLNGAAYAAFLYQSATGSPAPPVPDQVAAVAAYVNWGRWIAECSCGVAVVASRAMPFMICYQAGCDDFGNWKLIEYPVDKEDIETLLDRRPRVRDTAIHANWDSRQNIEDLKRENRDNGVSDNLPIVVARG